MVSVSVTSTLPTLLVVLANMRPTLIYRLGVSKNETNGDYTSEEFSKYETNLETQRGGVCKYATKFETPGKAVCKFETNLDTHEGERLQIWNTAEGLCNYETIIETHGGRGL